MSNLLYNYLIVEWFELVFICSDGLKFGLLILLYKISVINFSRWNRVIKIYFILYTLYIFCLAITLSRKTGKILAVSRVLQSYVYEGLPSKREGKRSSSPFCSGKASRYRCLAPLEYKRKFIWKITVTTGVNLRSYVVLVCNLNSHK